MHRFLFENSNFWKLTDKMPWLSLTNLFLGHFYLKIMGKCLDQHMIVFFSRIGPKDYNRHKQQDISNNIPKSLNDGN